MFNPPAPRCPPSLLSAARGGPKARAAIVNAGRRGVMEAVREAVEQDLIEPLLFGDFERIQRYAGEVGFSLAGVAVIDAESDIDAARQAAQAARGGGADLLVKGHIHTDDFLRAIIDRDAGLRTGERLTHVFSMTLPHSDRPLLITDAAVNVHPDFETLQSVVRNAVRVAHSLGLQRPRVAFLSATEEESEAVPSSLVAGELKRWAEGEIPDADFAGPLAMDLCISTHAAGIKGVDGPVAGNADIIVVPEIVTGNALFKAMVHMCGACSAGVVLGAKIPVVLTSRADPPEARLASMALSALMAKG